MLESDKNDTPIGAQILGSDPDMVLDAAHIILANSKPALIDLNFACPAKKVIKKKSGAYFLKEPEKAGRIVKRLASSLPLPITVKIRSAYSKNESREGLMLAKICQENGISAVFIHGRTVAQGYAGRVDYKSILEVKKALTIPVFGSGDILSPELAKKMLDETGCDGILVARGAMGHPWIFDQIEAYLKNGSTPSSISYEEIIGTVNKHLRLYNDWKKGLEKYYIGHMRKIAIWYTKGLSYAKRARQAISKAQNCDDIMNIMDRLKSDYDKSWLKK
jgi:tRNA-dihydrouridine synthase B